MINAGKPGEKRPKANPAVLDGDVAQEFYVEFGGKMFQYDPEILTAEQFLASLKEKQKSTSSVSSNNGSSGTTTHPSRETPIRLAVERKEKIADLAKKTQNLQPPT